MKLPRQVRQASLTSICAAVSVQAILYYTFGALGGDPLAQMTMVCLCGCGMWVGDDMHAYVMCVCVRVP